MRVSEHYNLNRRQPHLDFVDVDVTNDTPLFVDPRALLLLPSEWGVHCVELVKDFFARVLKAIRQKNHSVAQGLLRGLSEPNETHLGLSEGRSRGRAVGSGLANDIWESFRQSEAVHRGLLEELEDSILLVPGIGPDIISDITTNVIREPLIEYTQAVAAAYGIRTDPDVDSGRLWNPATGAWFQKYVRLPTIQNRRLLLVPKVIVRRRPDYDANDYYNHYILESLCEEELNANSALVEVLRDGRRRVTKKSLKEKYGTSRSIIVDQTIRHPDALRRYRDEHNEVSPPLDHRDLAFSAADLPDYDDLLKKLFAVRPGPKEATEYEIAIENLLYAIFYPSLSTPERQVRIHQSRKRIDITFQNMAYGDFFHFLSAHERCPSIFVECKNYTSDPDNPELDQLSGRFSTQRGRVGILVCPKFRKKDLFLDRCHDTAQDGRGIIIPLDNTDLIELVRQRRLPEVHLDFPLLRDRYNRITR